MIKYLREELNVNIINLGHRRENIVASRLYDKLGFQKCGEDNKDYYRSLKLHTT